MKCNIIIDANCEESVYVYLRKHAPIADEIQTLVTGTEHMLVGYRDKTIIPIRPEDITCVTVEDGKVFAITKTEKLRLQERLYQAETVLGESFVKINQSCLANIKQIDRFDARLAGSLFVIFKNGYRDYVSRRQLKIVKKKDWIPSMKTHLKSFFLRGMLFGGFGPIVAATVYLIHSQIHETLFLSGSEIFIAVLSTYVLAFIHAGVSVFHQIERWSPAKALACHFITLYLAYILCYLINAWLPFEPRVLVLFTVSFILLYAIIWFTVFLIIKRCSKRLNDRLH